MPPLIANLVDLLLDAAPWLALGLIIAGLIHAWLPAKHLNRWLGRPGFGSVVRAAIIGTPLPLCSCSVVPVAISLRRGGASRGATLSFLVSTPENGIDSITLSYALLGPLFTIVRPIAGICLAIAAGLAGEPLPGRATAASGHRNGGCSGETKASEPDTITALSPISTCCGSRDSVLSAPRATPAASACCSSTEPQTAPASSTSCCSGSAPTAPERPKPADSTATSGCCGTKTSAASSCCSSSSAQQEQGHWLMRGWNGIRYACSTLYGEMVPWLALGLLLAALVTTFLPPELLAQWGSGPLAMVLMLLIGVPMYICATASTPLAAAFLLAGISPGTVLVFLLAGPATNIGTLGIIRRELGQRALTGYLAAIAVGSIAFGLATDALVEWLNLDMQAQLASSHGHLPEPLAWGSAIVLILLAIPPIRRLLLRR